MASQAVRRIKMVCASLPQLPYISTARGTHTQPSSWHLGSLAMCLHCSLAAAAAPTIIPALFSTAGVSGEATVTSMQLVFLSPSPLPKHISLEEVGAVDPQVAFTLFRICGGFCKLLLLCIPQKPLKFLMPMYASALHNVLQWTHLIMPGTRLG